MVSVQRHSDDLEQVCGNSIANALELPHYCANPSIVNLGTPQEKVANEGYMLFVHSDIDAERKAVVTPVR